MAYRSIQSPPNECQDHLISREEERQTERYKNESKGRNRQFIDDFIIRARKRENLTKFVENNQPYLINSYPYYTYIKKKLISNALRSH